MIGDSETGYGLGVGHTLLVTEGTPEVLTALPDNLTVVNLGATGAPSLTTRTGAEGVRHDKEASHVIPGDETP